MIDLMDDLYISWQTINPDSFFLRQANTWNYAAYEKNIFAFLTRAYEKGKCAARIYLSIMLNWHVPKLMRALMLDGFSSLLGQDEIDLKNALGRMYDATRKLAGEDLGTLRERVIKDIRRGSVKIHLFKDCFLHIVQFHNWGGLLSGRNSSLYKIPTEKGACWLMLHGPQILADGSVALCCLDAEGRSSVGSVKTGNLSHILRTPTYSEIYEGFKQGDGIHDYCKKCKGLLRQRLFFRNVLFSLEEKTARLGKKVWRGIRKRVMEESD